MYIISYSAVTAHSQCQWYFTTCRPWYKSIEVVDPDDAILWIGTQVETLPEVTLTTAELAQHKINTL